MDDFDLDDILNSVEILDLPDPHGLPAQPACIDIDSLLDDVADSLLGGDSTAAAASTSGGDVQTVGIDDDEELDGLNLGAHLQAVDAGEWRSVIARVPVHLRGKWESMHSNDITATTGCSRFAASNNYNGKDNSIPRPKILFQECVRRALKKNKMTETQISEIMRKLLSDPARHDALMLAFQEEMLQMHRKELAQDPTLLASTADEYCNLKSYMAGSPPIAM